MVLTPEPKFKKIFKDQRFSLGNESKILIHRKCEEEVFEYGLDLKKYIQDKSGLDLKVEVGSKEEGCICFRISSKKKENEYHLVIKKSGISICGGSSEVIHMGILILQQIIDKYENSLPYLTINDLI